MPLPPQLQDPVLHFRVPYTPTSEVEMSRIFGDSIESCDLGGREKLPYEMRTCVVLLRIDTWYFSGSYLEKWHMIFCSK